jgi:hypothetical protein
MTSATTKNETQETYGMRLPEGMTCADCARFRFCNVFLGGNIATNRECDWAPSRFIQRRAGPPAPKPAGERKL